MRNEDGLKKRMINAMMMSSLLEFLYKKEEWMLKIHHDVISIWIVTSEINIFYL